MPGKQGYKNVNHVPRRRFPASGTSGIEGRLKAAGFDVIQSAGLVRLFNELFDQQAKNTQLILDTVEERMNSEVLPFSTTGVGLPLTVSKKWPVRFGGKVREVRIELDNAGSTSTVFAVRLNGVAIQGSPFTIPSSTTSKSFVIDAPKATRARLGDRAEVQVTTAGTGASGLHIGVWVFGK